MAFRFAKYRRLAGAASPPRLVGAGRPWGGSLRRAQHAPLEKRGATVTVSAYDEPVLIGAISNHNN